MKVVFMGTPDFAVGALKAIKEAGHEIVLVVTQPDRRKGRGKEVQFSAVKEAAVELGLPVYQPLKIKEPEAVAYLRTIPADIFVVAAFGQILSKEILEMPKYGCVNIHASLLPKYRGAAPIQWAVINGDKESGITIMQMNEGLDTGDILMQSVCLLAPKETGESLFLRLSEEGAKLIVRALEEIEKGNLTPVPQEDSKSCYAKMLTKDMGELHFQQPAVELERLIRGLNSWPSAFTRCNGKTMKIWDADVMQEEELKARNWNDDAVKPGTVLSVDKDSIVVKCGEGALVLRSIQLEGKKRMQVKDFLLGYHMEIGTVLG